MAVISKLLLWSPPPSTLQHLVCPHSRKITAISCRMGSGQEAIKCLCQSLPGWSTSGRASGQAHLGISLPSTCPKTFLTIPHAQSTSHTLFRSCCFYSRKQVIWRLHYFYDEKKKRALDIKYTHTYTNMDNYSLDLVFSLGKE